MQEGWYSLVPGPSRVGRGLGTVEARGGTMPRPSPSQLFDVSRFYQDQQWRPSQSTRTNRKLCLSDLSKVRDALFDVRSQWENIGIEFLNKNDTDAIKRQHSSLDTTICLRDRDAFNISEKGLSRAFVGDNHSCSQSKSYRRSRISSRFRAKVCYVRAHWH